MGFFSQLDIENTSSSMYDREHPSFSREQIQPREILEHQLAMLRAELHHLDMVRPHDRTHPLFDHMFFSISRRHYYETPETVQDILCSISEIEDKLWALECAGKELLAEQRRQVEMKELSSAINEQILLITYWDYAFLFKEAQSYRNLLSVLKQ